MRLHSLALGAIGLALASCAPVASPGAIRLEAEGALMPRLEAIVAAHPAPEGWIVARGDAENAVAALSLEAVSQGGSPPRSSFPCGTLYLAAAADLTEELYSISARRAEDRGLEPLESVILPRRALAVDGVWPGGPGYPFARALALSLRPLAPCRMPRVLERWLESVAKAASAADYKPIDLAAAGDMQVGESQWPLLASGEEGLASLMRGGVLDLVRKPDLAVANLESPISARGYPNPRKRYRFRMPPGSAAALAKAGFDLVLFGNNHGFDFGPEAFEDSLLDLERGALPFVGAGRDLAAASAAQYLDARGGGKVAFVGFAFYPSERMGFAAKEAAAGAEVAGVSMDEAATLASIRSAAASGATVVVLAHGGAEYVETPTAAARELYARFVDAGAALVAGSHPHLLQGCEARSGSLIAYSLGNFLFTGELEPPEAWKSGVLYVLFYQGKPRGLLLQPVIAGYDYTSPDPDRTTAEARFTALSAALLR
jgi:hypothetical protein